MSVFYCIHGQLYPGIDQRIQRLKKACEENHISCTVVDSTHISLDDIPTLKPGDMMYNVARGSEYLETLMLHPFVTTFYINNPAFIADNGDTLKYSMVLSRAGVPSPKTSYTTIKEKSKMSHLVETLGGFPLVIKTFGGTKGVGTMIVKDFASLVSLVDFMNNSNTAYVIREYIEPKEVARIIVVGNRVVASNQKLIPEGDFRTSVDHHPPLAKTYSEEINQLAIRAAQAANFENCGVDILIDQSSNAYVLEVNMPHDFITTEKATGIDISGSMIKHLASKATAST